MAKLPASLEEAELPMLPASFYYIPDFISAAEEQYILSKVNAQPWVPLHHRRLQVYPTTLTRTNVLLSSKHKHLPSWLMNPIVGPRFEQLGIFEDTKHGGPNHVLVNEYQPGQGIMPHEDGDAYAGVVATVSLGSGIVLDLYDKTSEETESTWDASPVSSNGQTRYRLRVKWRIYQEPRSLLVTRGDAYKDLLHGISEQLSDDHLKPLGDDNATSVQSFPDGSDSHATGEATIGVANWNLLGDKSLFENASELQRSTRVSLTYRDVLKVSKSIIG